MAGVTAVRLWKPSPGLRTKPATNSPQGSGAWQRRQVCRRPCAGRGRPWDDPRTSVPPTRGPCGWGQVASDRSLRGHTRSRGAKPAAHIQACWQLSWNPVNVTGFNTRCGGNSSRGCVRDKQGRRSHLIWQQQGSLVLALPGSPGPGSAPARPPPCSPASVPPTPGSALPRPPGSPGSTPAHPRPPPALPPAPLTLWPLPLGVTGQHL